MPAVSPSLVVLQEATGDSFHSAPAQDVSGRMCLFRKCSAPHYHDGGGWHASSTAGHSHIPGALFKDSAASRGGRDVSSRSSALNLCGSDRWRHTHSPNSQSGRALRLASHMAYTPLAVYSQRHASEELRCIDRMDRHYSWRHAGRKAYVREAIAGDG